MGCLTLYLQASVILQSAVGWPGLCKKKILFGLHHNQVTNILLLNKSIKTYSLIDQCFFCLIRNKQRTSSNLRVTTDNPSLLSISGQSLENSFFCTILIRVFCPRCKTFPLFKWFFFSPFLFLLHIFCRHFSKI